MPGDDKARSHMVPKPLFGPCLPSQKLQTLRHIGGDFENQVQASGTSGFQAMPGSFHSLWTLSRSRTVTIEDRKEICYQGELRPPSVPGGPTVHKRRWPPELREGMSPPK